MDSKKFRTLVKEELAAMMGEVEKHSDSIASKLETLRKKLIDEMTTSETIGWASNTIPEKRVGIKTVSELIDVPLHELTLYFLNRVKTGLTETQNIDYRMGQVYFRNTPESK